MNKRKDTPFPIKNTKKNEDFNAVISNRNIYQMEEDDEPVKEANDQDNNEWPGGQTVPWADDYDDNAE